MNQIFRALVLLTFIKKDTIIGCGAASASHSLPAFREKPGQQQRLNHLLTFPFLYIFLPKVNLYYT